MKKIGILLFFTFLMLSWNGNAQITITTADIATPGKVTYQANDTMPVISVGPAGTNQIWNFSGVLNAHTLDTLHFISPSDATEFYAFPSSNLIIPLNKEADVQYAINNTADLTVLASTHNKILFPGGEKTTIIMTNNPVEKVLEFPTTYSSSFTENYVSSTQYYYGSVPPNVAPISSGAKKFIPTEISVSKCGYSDSLREKKQVYKTIVADAWGTITTGAGTYSALRIKETKISVDTIDARDAFLYTWFFYKAKTDSIVTYYWYANNVGMPLVTATMDSTGNVKKAIWLAAPLGTLGIDEATSSNLNVFPNPAQNEITFNIEGSKVNSIIIYDITGRLIDSSPVSSDLVTINTSNYSNGVYTYSLFDKKKNILNRGKFSVVR